MKTKLELRMYGLVPYNISPIQQGIQYGHAVVDYRESLDGNKDMIKLYKKWAKKDKTFIILNGGTTNNNKKRLGSLNKHLATLKANKIKVQDFYEPDLNDALTGVCFLVDERVFNREKYPDFIDGDYSKKKLDKRYAKWVESVGGEKNVFLRGFLRGLRLA
jgi:hypothetical protein